MKVLVLNGPNLGILGRRETGVYGSASLTDIQTSLAPVAEELGLELEWIQSNHEGDLIEALQDNGGSAAGALLNAGALTHYGLALSDAVRAFGHPVVEVHITNVHARETWRRRSVLAGACVGGVYGFGADSYRIALLALARVFGGEGR
ncbi:MAG TPA: type II 3-dehydroquinate dehydratase [Gemmatimonadota bacterium]|nr:type II 3-dehydroquinate dehydratase [Gemmatimonadota bacterium]